MEKFVFKMEYSWLLVPIIFVLYFYYPEYTIPLMTCIGIIGIIELLFYDNTLPLWQKISSIIFHAILLIGLYRYNSINLNNIQNSILLVLGIIFIKVTPHWPYYMSKDIMSILYMIIYVGIIILFNNNIIK